MSSRSLISKAKKGVRKFLYEGRFTADSETLRIGEESGENENGEKKKVKGKKDHEKVAWEALVKIQR